MPVPCPKPMLYPRTFGFVIQETIDFEDSPIEDHDSEIMIGNIQNQILTHNGQTNKTEVTTGDDPRRSADIDAGQTGAKVSPWVQSTRFRLVKLH